MANYFLLASRELKRRAAGGTIPHQLLDALTLLIAYLIDGGRNNLYYREMRRQDTLFSVMRLILSQLTPAIFMPLHN